MDFRFTRIIKRNWPKRLWSDSIKQIQILNKKKLWKSLGIYWAYKTVSTKTRLHAYEYNQKRVSCIDSNSKRVDPGQSRMPINFNWLWLEQDFKLYGIFMGPKMAHSTGIGCFATAFNISTWYNIHASESVDIFPEGCKWKWYRL